MGEGAILRGCMEGSVTGGDIGCQEMVEGVGGGPIRT